MKIKEFTLEAKALATLCWPIVVSQLSQTGIGFVDTLMAGQYSTTDLAAIGLGTGLWIPVFLAFIGILMATTPLIAYRWGRQNLNDFSSIISHATIVAIVLGVTSFFILRNVDPVFVLMNLTPELAEKTDAYLTAFAWGMPAAMLFQVIRGSFEGVGLTKPIMYLSVMSLLVNIPLNYALIFGKWGAPELGSAGCGYASAISLNLMFLCGLVYFKHHKDLAQYVKPTRIQTKKLLEFLALGTPIGFSILIEASMFAIIALFLADLGEVVVGAHQVTLSYTSMTFMLPLSISLALTIRVGHHIGANNMRMAIFSTYCGLAITLSLALFNALIMINVSEHIAQLYSKDENIILLASALLIIAGIFQCSDAIQVTCAGILRGAKDTFVPLVVVFVCYWIIGFPMGYVLAKTELLTSTPLGAAGFWYALVGALTLSAVLLFRRVHHIIIKPHS